MGNNTNASSVTAFLQDPDLPITKDGAAYSDYVLLNANGTDTPGPPVNYPLDLANVLIAHYEQVWWLWRGPPETGRWMALLRFRARPMRTLSFLISGRTIQTRPKRGNSRPSWDGARAARPRCSEWRSVGEVRDELDRASRKLSPAASLVLLGHRFSSSELLLVKSGPLEIDTSLYSLSLPSCSQHPAL